MALFRKALARYGPRHPQALWWANTATQQRRFEVLAEVGSWEGAAVADVGCGLGDFFDFLEGRGLSVSYRGYDVSPEMIAAARGKHPHPRARFELRDIVARPLARRFDYVVASGTFNIRVPDHEAYLRRSLLAMYRACRRAMAVNVLRPVPLPEGASEIVAWCADFYYAIEPGDLLAGCRQLSPDVEIREHYLAGESTVFVRRPGRAA